MLRSTIFAFAFTAMAATAQLPDPAIAELRETISKIVDIQTLESKERLDWESRKTEMAALLELHHRELALLNEELETAGQSAPGHDESTEGAKYEIEDLKNSRRHAAEATARTIPRTLALAARFPTPLLKDCETDLATLSAWKTGSEPRATLQAEISILSKADQFNRRITRASEIRNNREVEVIYLGLASAYYTSRSGSAGIGRPGPEGWVWNDHPAIAGEITKILGILDKKRPPSMVTLPMEIR